MIINDPELYATSCHFVLAHFLAPDFVKPVADCLGPAAALSGRVQLAATDGPPLVRTCCWCFVGPFCGRRLGHAGAPLLRNKIECAMLSMLACSNRERN